MSVVSIRKFVRKLLNKKKNAAVAPEHVEKKAKKVSWNDVPTIHTYYLEDGETLGRRKVNNGRNVVVAVVTDAHKDLVHAVCGHDTICDVHITPKFVAKDDHTDLLAALGMV
jgi:hypothetical protein